MQRPDATLVKGFNEWKKHGRFVKKGAKAIKVLAPLIGKKKEKDEGKSDNEEKEKKVPFGFRYVNVFDVSSTDGEELPAPTVKRLEGDGEQEKSLLQEWIQKNRGTRPNKRHRRGKWLLSPHPALHCHS